MSAAKDPAAKWAKYHATMAAKRAAKPVSDADIMEANAAGMAARDDNKSVHDNPCTHKDLRAAWHEGWMSADAAITRWGAGR